MYTIKSVKVEHKNEFNSISHNTKVNPRINFSHLKLYEHTKQYRAIFEQEELQVDKFLVPIKFIGYTEHM